MCMLKSQGRQELIDWRLSFWFSHMLFPLCAVVSLLFLLSLRPRFSWDLVDQCHRPSLNFATGFTERLTCVEFWQSRHSSAQYIASGDGGGKLHIIEVPRALRRKIANEENLMRIFYEREIARARYVRRRAEVRKVKAQKEAQAKSKSASSVLGAAGVGAGDESNSSGPLPAGASASAIAAALRDEKAAELAAKEKADKARLAEEEKAEKDYQRLFEQFRSQLAPEEMRADMTFAAPAPTYGSKRQQQ
jgi:hypothetical protein